MIMAIPLSVFGLVCGILAGGYGDPPVSRDALAVCASVFVSASFIVFALESPAGGGANNTRSWGR